MSHLAFIQKMHQALEEAELEPHSWEIRSFPTIESTSTRVGDMLGLYDQVIVLSETQSQGKGRQNKTWYSPRGGLWISFGMLTDFKATELSTPLIEAIHQVIAPHVPGLEIKAPNDLLIEGKKVCGLLVETIIRENRVKQLIIGVGVNIDNDLPDEVSDIATRLADHNYLPNSHSLGSEIVISLIKTLRSLNIKSSGLT